MFHDKKFLKKLDESKNSKHVALDAGHWMVYDDLDAVFNNLKNFLQLKL
jgi:hypothetical protein